MQKIVIFITFITFIIAQPIEENIKPEPKIMEINPHYKTTEHEWEQNRKARYQFSTNVEDHISDLNQQRTEVRDGLNVKGSYSFSDGYYKRTIQYVADQNGYRVIGEEVEPLDGPQVDYSGTASVNNAAHGTQVVYSVRSIPIPGSIPKIVDH